jgi:DNA polymerase
MANGKLVHNSNFQNFKRGSDLRRAILAPEGYELATIDLSQIECRLLNFLAGQEDVIERFRSGGDPYVGIATAFYGRAITKADAAERGTGKQAELSCLGPDTLVLTNNGPKAITTVQPSDWLWDGNEWVSHQGVVSRGERSVINVEGLYLTPDHRVLCGNIWVEASALQNENTLFQALERGLENLPFPAMKLRREEDCDSLSCGAPVGHPSTLLCLKTFLRGAQRAVTYAQRKRQDTGQKIITVTQMCARMIHIVAGCLAESPLCLPGAGQTAINLMEEGAYARYSKIEKNFLLTLLHFPDGIIQNWNLIASITIKGIKKAIFALLRNRKTRVINVAWTPWRMKSQTYDILSAGPRNRFTVVTNAGFLIVHNCGYGCGPPKFQATAKLGIYGPPVALDLATAKRFVDLYRSTHGAVTRYWKTADTVLKTLANGSEMEWGPMHAVGRKIKLPNSACLNYETLEWHIAEGEGDETGWRMRTRHGWARMYGAKLVEQTTQALARVIVSQAMIRISRLGYRIVNSEHDSLWILIPKDGNEAQHLQRCKDEMIRPLPWLPGLPLDCEGGLK